jgi:hypothetical protein
VSDDGNIFTEVVNLLTFLYYSQLRVQINEGIWKGGETGGVVMNSSRFKSHDCVFCPNNKIPVPPRQFFGWPVLHQE